MGKIYINRHSEYEYSIATISGYVDDLMDYIKFRSDHLRYIPSGRQVFIDRTNVHPEYLTEFINAFRDSNEIFIRETIDDDFINIKNNNVSSLLMEQKLRHFLQSERFKFCEKHSPEEFDFILQNALKSVSGKVVPPASAGQVPSADGKIEVTEELLREGASIRGSWSNKQLKLLGVSMPLRNGWKDTILGTKISEQNYKKFLQLKDAHLKNKKKYKDLFNNDQQE